MLDSQNESTDALIALNFYSTKTGVILTLLFQATQAGIPEYRRVGILGPGKWLRG